MPCLIIAVGLMVPRLLTVLLYFTGWFEGAFDNWVWPVLGFIFLPSTLVWYGFVHRYFDGDWGVVAFLGLIVALLIDLGPVARARQAKVAR